MFNKYFSFMMNISHFLILIFSKYFSDLNNSKISLSIKSKFLKYFIILLSNTFFDSIS